jgi:hypothetical protein
MRKILLAILFAGCIILAHLVPFRVFYSALLNNEFENLLHSLGFAGITGIAFLYVSRLSGRPNGAVPLFVRTFLLLMAIGVGSETVQFFFSRDASVLDLVRDAGGILTTLFLIAAWRTKNATTGRTKSRVLGAAAGVVAALCLLPFLWAAGVILLRNASGPVLFTFERRWENEFIHPGEKTTLTMLPPPFAWTSDKSRRAARISFLGGTYPGITLDEVFPDWRRRQALHLSIFSPMQEPISLSLRVHDGLHNNEYDDRFNTVLHLMPGPNEVSIPIASIETAPRKRQMDMNRIASIVIFAYKPAQPFTLYLDNIVLE